MRAFIILGFLLAAANAASLGYNYGPGVTSSTDNLPSNIVQTYGTAGSGGLAGTGGLEGGTYQTSGSNYNTGGVTGSGSLVGGGGLFGGGSGLVGSGGGLVGSGGGLVGSSGGLIGGGGLGGGSNIVGGGSGLISGGSGGLIGGGSNYAGTGLSSIGGGSIGGGFIGSSGSSGGATIGLNLNALDSVPQTVEYSKQFFTFSAPEQQQDEGVIQQQLSNVLKKNLQVVFIKAPENNAATNAALQLAKQAIEQRTAIYVLSKENDGAQLVGQLQQIQENVPTTPEVRFIKYRTPGDIAHATQVIQSQYDNFGGSSQVIDGGIAPVLNYASGGSGGGSVLGGGLVGGSSVGAGSVGGGSVGGGLVGGGLAGGGLVGSGTFGGSSYGGSNYGGSSSGTGSLIGTGGSSYGGVSNTNANYLPPRPLKK